MNKLTEEKRGEMEKDKVERKTTEKDVERWKMFKTHMMVVMKATLYVKTCVDLIFFQITRVFNYPSYITYIIYLDICKTHLDLHI